MQKYSGLFSTTLFTFSLILAAFMPSSPAYAAGYLKFGDIKGESQNRGYEGSIEVLSWSWGETNSTAAAGMPAGKRQHKPIFITKTVDKASPLLRQAHTAGSVIPSMSLHLPNKTGGANETYLKVELKNVQITSYQLGNSANSMPTETISFSYEKLRQAN